MRERKRIRNNKWGDVNITVLSANFIATESKHWTNVSEMIVLKEDNIILAYKMEEDFFFSPLNTIRSYAWIAF